MTVKLGDTVRTDDPEYPDDPLGVVQDVKDVFAKVVFDTPRMDRSCARFWDWFQIAELEVVKKAR